MMQRMSGIATATHRMVQVGSPSLTNESIVASSRLARIPCRCGAGMQDIRLPLSTSFPPPPSTPLHPHRQLRSEHAGYPTASVHFNRPLLPLHRPHRQLLPVMA